MKQRNYLAWLAFSTTAFGLIGSVSAAEWQLAQGMGSVQFSAVQQGTKFTGRFETFSAQINIDPAAVESGSIVGTVDTSTVNTRDHDRDAALTDMDWFDSANTPEASFKSTSITAGDDGGYVAEGTLTLKGTEKPATMNFNFAASGSTAKFNGTMTINRFDFNVGQGWNDTSWVGQDVEVQIALELVQ